MSGVGNDLLQPIVAISFGRPQVYSQQKGIVKFPPPGAVVVIQQVIAAHHSVFSVYGIGFFQPGNEGFVNLFLLIKNRLAHALFRFHGIRVRNIAETVGEDSHNVSLQRGGDGFIYRLIVNFSGLFHLFNITQKPVTGIPGSVSGRFRNFVTVHPVSYAGVRKAHLHDLPGEIIAAYGKIRAHTVNGRCQQATRVHPVDPVGIGIDLFKIAGTGEY